MPVLEHLFEFTANKSPGKQSSQNTKRKGILHFVFENARGGTHRLKRVRMLPVRERARNLNVAEIVAGFEVLMLGNPAPAKRPSTKPQHGAQKSSAVRAQLVECLHESGRVLTTSNFDSSRVDRRLAESTAN
ncbi:MAG: hypothetical protein LAO08_02265 [Acidobacteriia bacterium]|nr:hypothetical protein [Terriglobia bacterium]